ncbi:hypothetical protein L1987_79189 [Smallanthus sonchifolius]|uniref:Uncharacterized protein n=1 Tax=Smallanthus sonchifolius TaxID=185202 RepID=A0ACB8ZE08_9ASTR|nr:hypothetical protein L1987_79189 [Smallanthus sonchifolius]
MLRCAQIRKIEGCDDPTSHGALFLHCIREYAPAGNRTRVCTVAGMLPSSSPFVGLERELKTIPLSSSLEHTFVLCDAEVAFIIFSNGGKFYEICQQPQCVLSTA